MYDCEALFFSLSFDLAIIYFHFDMATQETQAALSFFKFSISVCKRAHDGKHIRGALNLSIVAN